MRNRKTVGILAMVLCVGAITFSGAAPASAAGAVGASYRCDIGGARCVEGSGQSENAGTSQTGGKAVAVCVGSSSGAIILEVTCSHAGQSRTTSIPGPNGAAYVVADTDSIKRMPVCWSVTGYFYDPFGPLAPLTTSGCSQLSV
jgi:hypothetical protein